MHPAATTSVLALGDFIFAELLVNLWKQPVRQTSSDFCGGPPLDNTKGSAQPSLETKPGTGQHFLCTNLYRDITKLLSAVNEKAECGCLKIRGHLSWMFKGVVPATQASSSHPCLRMFLPVTAHPAPLQVAVCRPATGSLAAMAWHFPGAVLPAIHIHPEWKRSFGREPRHLQPVDSSWARKTRWARGPAK